VKEERRDEYQKALNAYGEAMKNFHQGKSERAEELLQAFIEKYPRERELSDRARLYLKICQERIGKSRERISLKTPDDYFYYSVYRLNQGDLEGAAKLLEKARDLAPKDGRTLYLSADLACIQGQTEECLEYLKKAVHADKIYAILAQNESDFQSLWEDKKFKVIVKLA
jgi:tetratricopeptide (TPR) repeat protein